MGYTNSRCFGFLRGTELVAAGLQTKEVCETNEIDQFAHTYERSAGLGSGMITSQCCSWSYCNFNATSLSITDPTAPLLLQLEGMFQIRN